MLGSNAFNAAVANIYKAAVGSVPWTLPLGMLVSEARALGIFVMGIDKAEEKVVFLERSGSLSPTASLDYFCGYHAKDPVLRLMMAGDQGAWLVAHERLGDEFIATNPFYQDFLIPHGVRWVSGGKVYEDEFLVVLFAALRGVHDGPFEAGEQSILNRAANHVGTAIRSFRHVKTIQSQAAVAAAILDVLPYPTLLIDAMQNIRFANLVARQTFVKGEYVIDRGGFLGFRNQRDERAFDEAVRSLRLQAQAVAPQDFSSKRAFVCLHRAQDDAPIAAHLIAVRPKETMGAFGSDSVALAIFHDPAATADPDPFLVALAFSLTPAEARVAVQLALGKTAAEIVAETGVSITTVRSQIKAALAKTGARRQPELVRMISAFALSQTMVLYGA